MDDKIKKLKEFTEKSNNIVFFGGAGVSTESGVPDFRSKDGLYNQRDVRFDKYQPEYLLSHSCLVNEPEVFFEFYRQKLDTQGDCLSRAGKPVFCEKTDDQLRLLPMQIGELTHS